MRDFMRDFLAQEGQQKAGPSSGPSVQRAQKPKSNAPSKEEDDVIEIASSDDERSASRSEFGAKAGQRSTAGPSGLNSGSASGSRATSGAKAKTPGASVAKGLRGMVAAEVTARKRESLGLDEARRLGGASTVARARTVDDATPSAASRGAVTPARDASRPVSVVGGDARGKWSCLVCTLYVRLHRLLLMWCL